MKQSFIEINNIPAVIWGEKSDRVIIAVHGNLSNKLDKPIEMMAHYAVGHGYQVLSFDLPEHGDRKNSPIPCKAQNCVSDLAIIMDDVKSKWQEISLFAVSIGAYFSLLAYRDEKLTRACFLSPLLDMQKLIEDMMTWFNISEEHLKREQVVPTPIGQNLYWDYYSYVREHPILEWKAPTYILCGSRDEICDAKTLRHFADRFFCQVEIVPDSEHYFHTAAQLQAFKLWLEKTI